jgi:hypothetical protein
MIRKLAGIIIADVKYECPLYHVACIYSQVSKKGFEDINRVIIIHKSKDRQHQKKKDYSIKRFLCEVLPSLGVSRPSSVVRL